MIGILRFTLFLLTASVLVFAFPALAQSSAPVLETTVGERNVEVGRPFSVQFSAMVSVSDRVPENPSLPSSSGLVIRSGPSISSKTQITLRGGNLVQQMGMTATWNVEATRPGKLSIGPPTVMWQGRVHAGPSVEVMVHPKGSSPQPQRRDPFDIFDIFGLPRLPNLFDDPFGTAPDPMVPPTDPSLAMEKAPDRRVFVRAMVDKSHVVLGEQVTLSVYEYFESSIFRKSAMNEASAGDFLQYPALDPTDDPGIQYAEVGESTWRTRLIRKVALIPLRVGQLGIGSLRVHYQTQGTRREEVRETKRLTVTVVEAPSAGRPVGYRSGDVGSFSLSASVTPRNIVAGDAVSVQVTLRGKGNLPSTLPTPSSKGIDWHEPEIREQIDAAEGKLGGERVFSYVVRLREPGTVDMGDIQLPHFNPERRRYETARASLGMVLVRENPGLKSERQETDRFASIESPRSALGRVHRRSFLPTDHVLYWLALVVFPVSVMVARSGWALVGRTRGSFRAWRGSLNRQVRMALDEAKASMRQDKKADAAAEIERAVHGMIESSTGLKSRAVMRAELQNRLGEKGVSDTHAQEIIALLEACETLRFDPTAEKDDLGSVLHRARGLNAALNKSRKRGKR